MFFELDEKVIYKGIEAEIIDVDASYLIKTAPDTFKWVYASDLKKVEDV